MQNPGRFTAAVCGVDPSRADDDQCGKTLVEGLLDVPAKVGADGDAVEIEEDPRRTRTLPRAGHGCGRQRDVSRLSDRR